RFGRGSRALAICSAERRPMSKPVMLIHGINSNGEWHTDVSKVLEPHFQCIPIRYRDYHFRGELKLFCWPWALPLAFLPAALASGCFGSESSAWRMAYVAAFVSVLVVHDEFRWVAGGAAEPEEIHPLRRVVSWACRRRLAVGPLALFAVALA